MAEPLMAGPPGSLAAAMPLPRSSPSASDAELLAAVRAGDLSAYSVLYQRHEPAAGRLARQLLGRGPDADDVVADTFTRVLDAIAKGGGPVEAFRPYLLTAVRRAAVDLIRRERRQIPTDTASLADGIGDQDEPFADPVLDRIEQSLVAQAFQSLPERWSAVLWHTEVERAKPADVAILLGLTPNGVSALSYRAREGLRQAYLQLHLASRTKPECQAAASKLGAYVRGGLSARDSRAVKDHLRGCSDCREAKTELATINSALRTVLAPALIGGLAWAARPAKYAAPRAVRWAARMLRLKSGAAVTAGALVAGVLLPGATVPNAAGRSPGAHATPHSVAALAARPPASRRGRSRSGRLAPPRGVAPRGSPSPSPAAGSAGPARLTARLQVSVSVAGLLKLGAVAIVTVRVADPGTARTGPLTSRLTLPPGVSLVGLPKRSSGWTCSARSCSHAAIAARARTTVAFRVLVVNLSGCAQPIVATVTSGPLSASAESAARVLCGLL
jgi:RNA polymerase sigma factor (sigma-70 family)